MLRTKALEQAQEIAKLLISASTRVARTPINQQGLFALAAISAAASKRDVEQLLPHMHEILIFGSIARGEVEVGDIDLMILDTGFYSDFLMPRKGQIVQASSIGDNPSRLRGNLSLMLEFFFEINANDEAMEQIVDAKVDLHVMPTSILTDQSFRQEMASRHVDPRFFDNAFSSMLRFNAVTEQFEPVTFKELEQKYQREPINC